MNSMNWLYSILSRDMEMKRSSLWAEYVKPCRGYLIFNMQRLTFRLTSNQQKF